MKSVCGDRFDRGRRFIIGVDFGTTFSAIAICFLGNDNPNCKPGKIKPVKLFPSSGYCGSTYRRYFEVPSDLRYEQLLTRWGYGVQAFLDEFRILPGYRINRFKLALDENSSTLELRRDVKDMLSKVPGNKDGETVIADYITELLKHIQWYLQEHCGYQHGDLVELVCTVPATWTQLAICKMITAFEDAQRRSDFGSGRDVEDVYLVSEPEAAAAHVLVNYPNLQLREGETFTICDAGGGTVDLLTYTVTNTDPWRLSEAVEGQGAPCGSSFLNVAFQKYLEERLEDEQYLDNDNESSIQDKIDAAVVVFEKMIKPDFGSSNDPSSRRPIDIPGLKRNEEKGFVKDKILIPYSDLVQVFRPIVDQVWHLIWSQIQEARGQDLYPKLLILVGGFAGSPFLHKHVVQKCSELSELPMGNIKVVNPDNPEFAIASGAIYRAANKENGPIRKSRFSIGIPLHVPFNKDFSCHKDVETWEDETDGKLYVRDSLDWVIKKGAILNPIGKPIVREYNRTIPIEEETCFLTARIFVLDRRGDDYYSMDHAKNRGCKFLEEVCFEFTAEQTAHLKEVIPRQAKKVAKPRKSGRKVIQPPLQPLRRSSRNQNKPNGKSWKPQYPGLDPDDHVLVEESPDEQPRSSNESEPGCNVSPEINGGHTTQQDPHATDMDLRTSEIQQLALHDSDRQPQDTNDTVQEYIQFRYKLIIEYDGLRLDYRIECTVGGVTHQAKKRFNLAKIFKPGTA